MIDFQNQRAIVVNGYNAIMTFTAVKNLAAVVVLAVDLAGEWPVVGGNRVPVSEVLKIGEKVRCLSYSIHQEKVLHCSQRCTGCTSAIEKVKFADLEKGILTASWTLEPKHPSVTGDQVEKMVKNVLIGTLFSSAKGAWDVSDEVNQLLPDFKFTLIEEFLTEVWEGKP